MLTESASPLHNVGKITAEDMLQTARQHARSGDLSQAEQSYRLVLEHEPDNIEALYRLAMLLHQGNKNTEESLRLLDMAVGLQSGNPVLHTSRAIILHQMNRPLDALESFADACCISPDNFHALYNIGLLCAELCCPAQAELYARILLSHRPDWPPAHYLLVRALTALDSDMEDLNARYKYLIKTAPSNPALRFAHGLLQLKMGNYTTGWEAQEWRWEIEPLKSTPIDCAQPRWAGTPLDNRRLLVWGEQGFGDMLQFARYLPQLVKQCGQVILRLDANRSSLARLLGKIKGITISIAPDPMPPFDLYCPIASLPYVLDTTMETIPTASYLQVDAEDIAVWRNQLINLPRPWTGLCWAGSPEHNQNIRRSLPLYHGHNHYHERQIREQRIVAVAARLSKALDLQELTAAAERDSAPASFTMQPFLERIPGTFVSLQVGPQAQEIENLPPHLRARFVAPLSIHNDFYDTACLIQALDEVITVDTSIAHVTGSVGQQGTVIKPAAPEWRWIESCGYSTWYPTLKLMEQSQIAAPLP